jgi:tRNA-Thr(GGU) m(6)t(6)A37 methyltransferase TsaA
MKIEYRPIGVIHTPHKKIEGMPIQPSRAEGILGTVEVLAEFAEGLADLDGFSHIVLLYHFHKSSGHQLSVVPFLDDRPRGLFATRAPRRPNPIGLSVVRLIGVEGNRLSVEDVDMLDGTPLLDIKPYVPEFDERSDIHLGWLEAARERKRLSDDRFE